MKINYTNLANYSAYIIALVSIALVITNVIVSISNYLQTNTALAYGAYPTLEYKADITKKEYAYNENIDERTILAEMEKLAEHFNLDPVKWEKLLRQESTCTDKDNKEIGCEKGKINNLLRNPDSTATGIGQFLIGTWYETESWKKFRKARTDYKASLWEMGLDLSTGEAWRWEGSNKIIGIYDYSN